MGRPDEFGSLQTGEWGRIQELADRFERACQQSVATGTAVDLNTLLPGRDDPLRRVALYELIKIDMEFRWGRGQIITLDHYLEAYPELGPPDELSPKLIYEEYRLSQLNGVNTSMSVYNKRFPKQFEEVQKLIHEGNAQTRMPSEVPSAPPPSAPASGGSGIGSGLASLNPLASGQDAGMIVGGRYKLERKIGSGAFGEVWRGKSLGGVEVAIKIIFRPLDNEEAKSELTAMELIRTLRHPFLLQTHDFWPEQDRLVIVMELADGSLRDRLKACKKLGMTGIPAKELLTYFHQAAEAIDYLHGKRLLHRDIKPDNILLQEQYAKVADFGLARLMSTRRSAKMSGSGTPAYMAPEMWSSQVNQFSDQYCLATSYAELRQGKALFQGQDIIQLMRAHLQEQPNLSGLPPQEKEVVLRALDKVCEKRFGTCGEFVAALTEVVDTGKVVRRDVSHVAVGAPERPTPPPHPGLIHDDWPDDQAGTLRPGATGLPAFPSTELRSSSPEAADTDSREMMTVPGAGNHPLPSAPPARSERATPASHPVQITPRPPSWHSTDRAPSTAEIEAAPAPKPASLRQASWKAPTAGMERGKIKLLLGVGTGLALLALVGFLFWNAGSRLKSDTVKDALAGKFNEALERIDHAGFLALPFRASARTQLQEIWRNHVNGIHDSENYAELEKAAEEFLKRFPDDEKTAALLDVALKHNIPPLIQKGEFASAYGRLAAASPKSKLKDKLLEDLHTKWLDQARKELAKGANQAAQDTTLELLKWFKNDPAAEGLRRNARFQIVAGDVRNLKKDQKFDAALARLSTEARDLDPEDVAKLKHEVEHARHDLFHGLVEKAQEDLNGNKVDECLAKLAEAEKLAGDDADRATIQKWVIKAGSGPVAPLLEKADREFAKEEFADCQKTARQGLGQLDKVRTLARKEVEQQLDTYLVLAWARDPDRDEKQGTAMQGRFTKLFEEGSSPRLGELSRAYLQIAKTLPRWREQAQSLRGVLAKLAPADRSAVERELDAIGKAPPPTMFSEQLAQGRTQYDKANYAAAETLLDRIDPADVTDPAARNEWRALRALTKAALKRPEASRYLSEALNAEGVPARQQEQLSLALAKLALEKTDVRASAVTLLAKILPGLPSTPDKDKARCYLAYLSGLNHREADQFEEAAKDMLRAYAVPTDALAAPDRATVAADVLSKAAEALPRGDDLLAPFPNRADADKAYQWLEKAQTLLAAQKKGLPVTARVKLALAANFKTDPDRKLARDLADQLVTKEGQEELPLLVVRAQAQEDAEHAVGAYADILKRFKKKQSRSSVSPKDWFTAILQPAVTQAGKVADAKQKPAEVKADLAKCYATYGRFVREHLFEDWTPKNPKQTAFDSYTKAVELDATNPDYWIGRAYSGAALAKVDWSEVKQDTAKALDLGPKSAAAHGLAGYVDLLQSRRDGMVDRKKQLAELKEADQALAKAMELAKSDEQDKPTLLLNRSIVCVELGNYLANREERKKYLYAARDYAAQAADPELHHPYPELVQEAWGNALEDIALFLGESDAYPQAVVKFTAAIKRRPFQARFFVGRGRTQYRWAGQGKYKDTKLLDNAMADLENATSPLSRAAAEAYYWEGMIFQARHQPKEARAAFAKAIDIGQKYNGRDWVQLTLEAGRDLMKKQPEEVIKLADEAAKLVERDRKAFEPAEVARLLVDIYKLKANAGLQQVKHAKGEALTKAQAVVEAAAAEIQENGDLPQAAYVRGHSYDYAKKPQEAIKAYSAGLADYFLAIGKGDTPETAALKAYRVGRADPDHARRIHGLLLISRASGKLEFNNAQETVIPQESRDEMLTNLRAAIKLVPDDTDKASAWYWISQIHAVAANYPGAPAEERMDAVTSAREAIKADAKNTHPDRAGMRSLLALNLFVLAKKTPDDTTKLKYLNEGIDRAREAVQMEYLLSEQDRKFLHNINELLLKEKTAVEARLSGGG